MYRRILIALGCLLFVSLAFAHGGEEHVMGTVTNISGNTITVESTSNRSITVGITDQTKFEKSGSSANLTDLKVGDKVVIHAKKQGEKLVAHQVRFGAVPRKSNVKGAKGTDHSHTPAEQPKQ